MAFDLAQYFPSLNHNALTLVLDQMGFADSVVKFFSNYLVGRFTRFFWDAKLSDPVPCDVGVGQAPLLVLLPRHAQPHLGTKLPLTSSCTLIFCLISFKLALCCA